MEAFLSRKTFKSFFRTMFLCWYHWRAVLLCGRFEIACNVAVLVFRPVSARGDVSHVCSCDGVVERLLWESE